ncbi:MAG: exosortase system-associated protein, TIGR04073 family [Candidatus Omnitrophica bacterium]|nr:exosortase system-associated protein, TIGR04073 family [Candidatus Omnitrophota bacterium]
MARRTILIALVVFLLTVAFTSPAYCNDPVRKLGRGICNLFTFPLELYTQFADVNDHFGLFAAATWGILKGVGMSAVRLSVGVYEVATFPIPIPGDYMPILTDPEFYGESMAM